MSTEVIPITVTISDRTFSLRVPASQEATVRMAAQTLEKTIQQCKESFSRRDPLDYTIMAALTLATELQGLKETVARQEAQMTDRLSELNTLIEDYLHPTQNSL